VPAPGRAEPGEVVRQDERQAFVDRLENLTLLVERIARRGVVAGDARVQHEVVVPAGHRQRIELDRAQLAEDVEHSHRTALERSGRREEVPSDEEAPRRLGGDREYAGSRGA
jgi:hypothetical protein